MCIGPSHHISPPLYTQLTKPYWPTRSQQVVLQYKRTPNLLGMLVNMLVLGDLVRANKLCWVVLDHLQQMQVGQEIVEEVEKTQVEQQVETSNKDLQTLVSEGLELVTNVRIANDAREVKRREENVVAHQERMAKLDQELVAGAQKLEEINARWEGILETNDPLDLYHDIHQQRVKCSELMSQKDQLIQELRKELHLADDRFMRDQRRQKQDLGLLCERIDQQVVVMGRAYKQELLLVEVGSGTGATTDREE
uniref:Dynein regulatory complex protein 1/2 N-terminal domain-containing protein n=1 Tax=Timema poppense TaxID=170557 RepID=A0A7R9GX23_TIMPO|nr:unnamed protein product [Timema poppensis]